MHKQRPNLYPKIGIGQKFKYLDKNITHIIKEEINQRDRTNKIRKHHQKNYNKKLFFIKTKLKYNKAVILSEILYASETQFGSIGEKNKLKKLKDKQ